MERSEKTNALSALAFTLVVAFSIAYAAGLLGTMKNYLLPAFAFFCGLYLLDHYRFVSFNRLAILISMALCFGVVATVSLSSLGGNWLVQSFMSLIIAAYLVIGGQSFFGSRGEKAIYIVVLLLLLGGFLFSMFQGSFFMISDRDKNFTALLALLFAMYSYKTRRLAGSLIGVVIVLASTSRSCQLALLVSVLIIAGKHWANKRGVNRTAESEPLSLPWIFSLFFLTAILIIPFSYFWVNVVSGSGYSLYQASIVDSSNQIRMNSNIYAFELMASDPSFLYSGYGDSTLSKLGIAVDSSTYADSTQYGGLRIVQPHNSVLNEILRNGVLITLLYYMLLSYVLRRTFTFENMEFIAPILFISMFMHSLFIQGFLLMWVLLLVAPSGKTWATYLKKGRTGE